MEFRLVYSGRLPAASQSDTRVREKHEIRRVLGKQLAELWNNHPRLKFIKEQPESGLGGMVIPGSGGSMRISSQKVVYYTRCNRRFLPLVTNNGGVGCSLDILFLRRDQPGDLVRSGGDIDNRIKVLFDALRVPSSDVEVSGDPQSDDDPFYCLLEDDRLITELKVTTDRLLTPIGTGEHVHDVHLIIHVKTVVIDSRNLAVLGF